MGKWTAESNNLKMTGAGRRGAPTLRLRLETHVLGAQGHGYLVFLFIVQLLSISIRLSNQGVHQHQEGHVEEEGPYHRQVDDNDDLRKTSALFCDPASRPGPRFSSYIRGHQVRH